MAKSFTINTPKYQTAQKEFYAYNVTNDKSVLNTSNIKSTTFSFHLNIENVKTLDVGSSPTIERYVYTLDDENSAELVSLQNFYINNYDKIIDMSAKGSYNADFTKADTEGNIPVAMSASNIFSKDVNAYILDMSIDTGKLENSFILTINAAAKSYLMLGGNNFTNSTELAPMDSFTFITLPASEIDSSEKDTSKLIGAFIVYGYPYFMEPGEDGNTSGIIAESDISVTIYYMGDDK